MKNRFANLSFNVYRRILIFYFLLVICTVLAISSTLFYLFSSSTVKEISHSSQAMLGQTSYTSELLYEKVSSIAKVMTNNPRIVDVMYAGNKDPVDEYEAKLVMSNLTSAYPFIKYIGIYNKATGRYVTDQGVPLFENQDRDLLDILRKGTLSDFISFIPRESSFMLDGGQKGVPVLSYVICPNFYLEDKSAYIIINIDESYIQNLIHSMLSSNADQIFVLDADGTVLSNTDPQLFMTNMLNQAYIDKVLSSDSSNGAFTEHVNGTKQLITYVKSNTLNWYFVSVQPYNELISGIHFLRNITFWIAVLIVIISAVLSAVFLQDLYAPIRTLVDRVNHSVGRGHALRKRVNEFEVLSEAFAVTMDRANSLEYSYNKAYSVFKKTCLHSLLEGNFDNLTMDEKIRRRIEEELEWPYFCTLIIKIDNYNSFKEQTTPKHQQLLKFAIRNISKEILEEQVHCHTIDLGKDQTGVLICMKENSFPSVFTSLLERIQAMVESLYKFSISISIGDIVNRKEQIPSSYESAIEYANYRLYLGRKSIIHFDKIKHQLDHTDEYPDQIEKRLIKSIESLHHDKMEEEIRLFVDRISQSSFQLTMMYCNQLIVTIFKYFSNVLDMNGRSNMNYYDLITQLKDLETLHEIQELIQSFSIQIHESILESKNKSHNSKVYEVEKYLRKNYTDPNITLESMAALVDVSPGYFGKIFRSVNNCSFNEYLNFMRLEHARRMLIETDRPIHVICEQVGISNTNYFYTLFKKTYGITPALYRKNPEKLQFAEMVGFSQ